LEDRNGTWRDYKYDAQGNLTRTPEHSYSYDLLGRLVDVDYGWVKFVYSAGGEKLLKIGPGDQVTAYHYGGGELLSESEYVDSPAGFYQVSNTYNIYSDTGLVATFSSSSPTVTNTPGFVARYYDPDIGLYQLGARWYDPDIGRFVSADPIPSSLNQYAYAGNNPFRYQDRSGLQTDEWALSYEFIQRQPHSPPIPLFVPEHEMFESWITTAQSDMYDPANPPLLRNMATVAFYGSIGLDSVLWENTDQLGGDIAITAVTFGLGEIWGISVRGAASGGMAIAGRTGETAVASASRGRRWKSVLRPFKMRRQYESEVRALSAVRESMEAAGHSQDDIARVMVHQRNWIRMYYLGKTPQPLRAALKWRNSREYDTVYGPSLDWLLSSESPETLEKIISGATKF
jgi:RHS repeat-associated protein